jgi:hypothetical protein
MTNKISYDTKAINDESELTYWQKQKLIEVAQDALFNEGDGFKNGYQSGRQLTQQNDITKQKQFKTQRGVLDITPPTPEQAKPSFFRSIRNWLAGKNKDAHQILAQLQNGNNNIPSPHTSKDSIDKILNSQNFKDLSPNQKNEATNLLFGIYTNYTELDTPEKKQNFRKLLNKTHERLAKIQGMINQNIDNPEDLNKRRSFLGMKFGKTRQQKIDEALEEMRLRSLGIKHDSNNYTANQQKQQQKQQQGK